MKTGQYSQCISGLKSIYSNPLRRPAFSLRHSSTFNTALDKEIHLYSTKRQTPVSLKSLMETGRGDRLAQFDDLMKIKYEKHSQPHPNQRILIQVACFLHRELPIRLAQRAMKLESYPLFTRSGEFLLVFFVFFLLNIIFFVDTVF
jgi:hypothetical protein